MQQHLAQFVLAPALPQREAKMNGKFWLPPGGRVRDSTNQRARLQIEAWSRPQRAEHVLRRYVEKFLHHRVGVDLFRATRGSLFAVKLASHRCTLAIEFALGHLILRS